MLIFSAIGKKDLQTVYAVVTAAIDQRMSIAALRDAIEKTIAVDRPPQIARPVAARHRSETITTCYVCGKEAVIVPLARADRTPTATHAIQCQNRPATDQPWREGMCGHTEYIVRGER